MSRIENQRRLFLELVELLRPHWHRDPGQPQRLADWLARHRAGSRDRRLYRELTYTLWRILPWVEDASPDTLVARVAQHAQRSKATADFIDAYAMEAAGMASPTASLLPPWIDEELACDSRVESSLLSRAPLWIRQQSGDATAVKRDFPQAEPSRHIDNAWRLPMDTRVFDTPGYRNGVIEIQDIGSQALLHCLPELPAGRWLDACAGAGGKTLQLAQLLSYRPDSEIVAHDVRPAALRELEQRRKRAGMTSISTTLEPTGSFDVVLVDAPCTGSGTWRRAPHLKWTTNPNSIRRAAEKQSLLLDRFSQRVKPGGWLVYLTCSLCRSENESVRTDFLTRHPAFQPLPINHPRTQAVVEDGYLTLNPWELDSDGYFVAAMRRI